MDIDTNPANYEPNSINDNWPRETPPAAKRGGFESLAERVDGEKIRQRSPSFGEYYAQPRLFWLSQTPIEQQHIIDGFSFELSKVVRTGSASGWSIIWPTLILSLRKRLGRT